MNEDTGQLAGEEVTLTTGSLHWTTLSSGGAVPSLGGGAMNLASLLGGGSLQTQINLLTGALSKSTTGLLDTSGVPIERLSGT